MDTSITKLINMWKRDPAISSSIEHWAIQFKRDGSYTCFPKMIHADLVDKLQESGIDSLYRHQAEAINSVMLNQNTCIATGTASGKTLCFQIPILNDIHGQEFATALCLYPTKALAQDQLTSFRKLAKPDLIPNIAIYDGDTPQSARKTIRENGKILLTNPDMLHIGILPHHTNWAGFLRNLKYIILDEYHLYRGVFGSHIANVLRRLRRISRFYGAEPVYIGTSATIGNPKELFSSLIGMECNAVTEDYSPSGEKNLLLYNPPIINEKLGIRRSALSDSVRISGDLFAYGIQTLVFSQTRRSVEIFLKYLQENHPWDADSIYSYRSGYLPQFRRQIEEAIKTGKARVIASTNALELGVDIGSLDCVLTVGYPGTISSFRQEIGRAGRKLGPSLGMMIASANPLDQYILRHPDYIFGNNPESARINPDNPLILLDHIKSALFELPFASNENFGVVSSDLVNQYLDVLSKIGIASKNSEKYFWTAENYPADSISLRTASPIRIQLISIEADIEKVLGYVDLESSYRMVHPGAVYLHSGDVYLVDGMDIDHERVLMHPGEPEYFTEAITHQDVQLELLRDSQLQERHTNHYGDIIVNSQVAGFRKLRWYTNEVMETQQLDMPIMHLNTTGFWLALDQSLIEELDSEGLWSGSPNDYGPAWQLIRNKVLIRDKHTCQHCGSVEGPLHIHHLIPFRQFQDKFLANNVSNLVTLCSKCHKLAEMQIMIRSGLAGITYLLHNLAPLFVMCDINDLGSFSEPSCKFADGKPVILLYDALPGGVGLAEAIFKSSNNLLTAALETINECECVDGCPSCVGVSGEFGTGGKAESKAILQHLLSVHHE